MDCPGQGMRPPGFAEALDQGFVRGVEEDQLQGDLLPEGLQDLGKGAEEAVLADVDDQGDPVDLDLLLPPEVDEDRDHLDREVVDAVEPQVLEEMADDGLPRARQPGDDQEPRVLHLAGPVLSGGQRARSRLRDSTAAAWKPRRLSCWTLAGHLDQGGDVPARRDGDVELRDRARPG